MVDGTSRADGSLENKSAPSLGAFSNGRDGVKALVRWATDKRLTNRPHELSLITLSPL